MRLATIRTPAGERLMIKKDAGYVDLARATGRDELSSLEGFFSHLDESLESARRALSTASGADIVEYAPHLIGASVPRPARVLCLGVNYADHAIEGGREVPDWPESFVRGASSVVGPFDNLVRPSFSDRFDYEGELAVVIGRGGRYIRASEALEAVLGVSVMNDGSAREWQRRTTQWTPGKNFDATMPLGPEIVTLDEVNVDDLELTTEVNGDIVQHARTNQMIVSVARAVEFFSSFTTLHPGDVIATGTPGGVGFARTPPLWLCAGDVVRVTIEGVGQIVNRVVDEEGAPENWPWRAGSLDTSSF